MQEDLNIGQIEKYTRNQVLNIACNMRKFRKDNNYTQMDLAVKLDCSDSFISGVERGIYLELNLLTLNKICFLFGVSLEELTTIK